MKSRILIGFVSVAWLAFVDTDLRGETFNIDAVHSSVLYRIGHANVGHSWGRFNDFSGTINWDDANPSAGAIDVTIKSESIDSGAGKRDEHLREARFSQCQSSFRRSHLRAKKFSPLDAKTFEVTGS